MTRKDYQLIAEILATVKLAENMGYGVEESKKAILKLLATTNPKFDPERFWSAVEHASLENDAITK